MTESIRGYIVIGSKPYKLTRWNGIDVFLFNGNIVWYDALRDGPVVTEAEMKEKYPEWLL